MSHYALNAADSDYRTDGKYPVRSPQLGKTLIGRDLLTLFRMLFCETVACREDRDQAVFERKEYQAALLFRLNDNMRRGVWN